jgi:hypothetical protein
VRGSNSSHYYPDRDAALIEKSQEYEEDNIGQEQEQQEIQYEEFKRAST